MRAEYSSNWGDNTKTLDFLVNTILAREIIFFIITFVHKVSN